MGNQPPSSSDRQSSPNDKRPSSRGGGGQSQQQQQQQHMHNHHGGHPSGGISYGGEAVNKYSHHSPQQQYAPQQQQQHIPGMNMQPQQQQYQYPPYGSNQQQQHPRMSNNNYSQPNSGPNNNNNYNNYHDSMNRNLSDASMSYATDDQQPPANNNNNKSSSNNNSLVDFTNLTLTDDDTVPTVFRWEHGGRQVYITGTFNGWSRQIPMHRSGNDFTYIHNLKRGKHAFKFIVDDVWRFAPDQPTVADIEGRINNFIDVTDFKAYTGDKDFEREKAAAEYGCYYSKGSATAAAAANAAGGGQSQGNASATGTAGGNTGAETNAALGSGNALSGNPSGDLSATSGTSGMVIPSDNEDATTAVNTTTKDAANIANRPDPDGEVFTHTMPDLDEYTKEPPPLPPHLRHIILNKPPQLHDTAALPVPQHVALNHLYCTAIKDNMMMLGITQRYKTKFVTTVYYSPCAS